MGFKLRKRQIYLFVPAILGEVALERMLNLLQLHLLWQAFILLVVALFLTIWILKGNAIFYRSFYLTYRDIEREKRVITPTEEQLKRILPKQDFQGRDIHIPNHIEKEKVRIKKKRFEA